MAGQKTRVIWEQWEKEQYTKLSKRKTHRKQSDLGNTATKNKEHDVLEQLNQREVKPPKTEQEIVLKTEPASLDRPTIYTPISFKRKRSSSKYKGVLYVTDHKKWRAQICYQGKKKCVGSFKTQEEAAIARDKKVIELFGAQLQLLNFPRKYLPKTETSKSPEK